MGNAGINLWRRWADSDLSKLPPQHVQVILCLLSSHLDGTTYLSLSQIAADCAYYENRKTRQYSKQKVSRIISDLKECGFLCDNSDGDGTAINPSYDWLARALPADNSDGDGTAMERQEVTKKQVEKTTKPPPRTVVDTRLNPYSESFEEFWALYPRKAAKGYAWECWQRIGTTRTATVKEIMDGLQAQVSAKHFSAERRLIPMPSTWLNQRRWEDEPEPYNKGLGEKQGRTVRFD